MNEGTTTKSTVKQTVFLIRVDDIEHHQWSGEVKCFLLGQVHRFHSLSELLHIMKDLMDRLNHPPQTWELRRWVDVDKQLGSAAGSKRSR